MRRECASASRVWKLLFSRGLQASGENTPHWKHPHRLHSAVTVICLKTASGSEGPGSCSQASCQGADTNAPCPRKQGA